MALRKSGSRQKQKSQLPPSRQRNVSGPSGSGTHTAAPAAKDARAARGTNVDDDARVTRLADYLGSSPAVVRPATFGSSTDSRGPAAIAPQLHWQASTPSGGGREKLAPDVGVSAMTVAQDGGRATHRKSKSVAGLLTRLLRRRSRADAGERSHPACASDRQPADGRGAETAAAEASASARSPLPSHARMYREQEAEKVQQQQRPLHQAAPPSTSTTPASRSTPVAAAAAERLSVAAAAPRGALPWERVCFVEVKSLANDSDDDDNGKWRDSGQRSGWLDSDQCGWWQTEEALPRDAGAGVRRSRSFERGRATAEAADERPRSTSSSRDIFALYTSGCSHSSPGTPRPASRASSHSRTSSPERRGDPMALAPRQKPAVDYRLPAVARAPSTAPLSPPERGWSNGGGGGRMSRGVSAGNLPQSSSYRSSNSDERPRSLSATRTATAATAAASAAAAAAAAAADGGAETDVISINGVRVLAPGYFSRPRRALSSNDIAVENLRLWMDASQERQRRLQQQQQQQWQWQQQQEQHRQKQQQIRDQQQQQQQQLLQQQWQQQQWQQQQRQQQQWQQQQWQQQQWQQQQWQQQQWREQQQPRSLSQKDGRMSLAMPVRSDKKHVVAGGGLGGGVAGNHCGSAAALPVLETDRYEESRVESLLSSSHSLSEALVPMMMVARHAGGDARRWSSQDELDVDAGAVVLGLYKQNDWLRVLTCDGREGFVPYAHTHPLRQSAAAPGCINASNWRNQNGSAAAAVAAAAAISGVATSSWTNSSAGLDSPAAAGGGGGRLAREKTAMFGALRGAGGGDSGGLLASGFPAVAASASATCQFFQSSPLARCDWQANVQRLPIDARRRMPDDSTSCASSDDSVFRSPTPSSSQRPKHRAAAVVAAASPAGLHLQPPRPRRPPAFAAAFKAARAESFSPDDDDGVDVVHSDSGISEPASVRSDQCGGGRLPAAAATAAVAFRYEGASARRLDAAGSTEVVANWDGRGGSDAVDLLSAASSFSATELASQKHGGHVSPRVSAATLVAFDGRRRAVGCGDASDFAWQRTAVDNVRSALSGGGRCYYSRPDIPRNFDGPVVVVAYDYTASNADDVSVLVGETVRLLNADDTEWVWVLKRDGLEGFVPRQYVRIESSAPVRAARHLSTAL